MKILDHYIDQLIEQSTPEAPMWSTEEVREGSKSTWNYIDGCMIKAITELYLIIRNRRYLNFADVFTGHFIREDNSTEPYDPKEYSLDNVNAGETLSDLYRLTGKGKYRRVMDIIHSQLEEQPRMSTGNFWHKKTYPNQIWLDGPYMTQPFYMQCETEYNSCKDCEGPYQRFLQVYDRVKDLLNGLYYHVYDDSRQMFWCDKVTGLSENFWLRATDWHAMALTGTVEVIPESIICQKARPNATYKELIDAMLPYQDWATGMWHQVVNRGRVIPNYLEESGSAILIYAIMRSVRPHYLPDDYFKHGQKVFEGICSTYLSEKDSGLQLGGICLVTELGNADMQEDTFGYYMREPVVGNGVKGIAPLVLMYIETMFRCQSQDNGMNSGIDSSMKQAVRVIEPMSCFQYNDTENGSFTYFSSSALGKARTRT